MTKIHETFYRNQVKKFNEFKDRVKGEITVIISKVTKKIMKHLIIDRLKT